jgi:thiol peroxidase
MVVRILVGLTILVAILETLAGCSRGPVSPPAQGQAAYDALPVMATEQQFQQQVLDSPRPVLVDFSTDWCKYCRELAPTLGVLSQEYQGRAVFVRVDGDRSGSLVQKYGIHGYPTVMIFRHGARPVTLVGVREDQEYRSALDNSTSSVEPVNPPDKMSPVPTAGIKAPEIQLKGNDMAQTAASERTVTMRGQPMELVGTPQKVGDKAPNFVVVDNDLKETNFYDIPGKAFVILSVPSLDTRVCDIETRRFNEEAAKLGADVKVLAISMDLPFAQKRWCAGANIKNVQTLSDYRYASFGSAYGVLIKDLRLHARCVFVLDANRKFTYIQLVPEVSSEPNYDSVLEAVRNAAG